MGKKKMSSVKFATRKRSKRSHKVADDPSLPEEAGSSENKENCRNLANLSLDGMSNQPSYCRSSFNVPAYCHHSKANHCEPDLALFPAEILLHIFAYLPKTNLLCCEMVCKRWQKIVGANKFWKSVTLETEIALSSIQKMLTHGTEIMNIRSKINAKEKRSVNYLPKEPMECQKFDSLQSLTLTHASIKEKTLEILLSWFTNLESLELPAVKVTRGICRNIAANKKLLFLHMSEAYGIAATNLGLILRSCKKITELTMCRNISMICVLTLENDLPAKITRLQLSNQHRVGDLCLKYTLRKCPKLKVLDISNCKFVTSRFVEFLLRNGHGLLFLLVIGCTGISPDTYIYGTQSRWLYFGETHLSVDGSLDHQRLLETMPNLTILQNPPNLKRLPAHFVGAEVDADNQNTFRYISCICFNIQVGILTIEQARHFIFSSD